MRFWNILLPISGKQISFLGNMRKKNLIPTNLDGTPLISMGDPNLVSGARYTSDASFKDTGWHHHDMAVLGCMEAGIIGLRTDKESMVLSSGMMVFVPAFVSHLEVGMGTDVTGWYLCLPKNRISFMPNEVCALRMSDLLLLLCKKIVSLGPIKHSEKTPAQKRFVLTFLDELADAEKPEHLSIPLPRTAALCLVASQILSNPGDMETIDHWARVAAMSRRSFTKYFHEETGISFARWRQLVKLQQSLKLLAEGKSVTDIALDLGYQNSSNFIANFRKQFGVPPTKYMRAEKRKSVRVGKLDFNCS